MEPTSLEPMGYPDWLLRFNGGVPNRDLPEPLDRSRPMFTIMQIADLHRSDAAPVSNDELISCLIADQERMGTETPAISRADAIVVCGDLVQGQPLGGPGYPEVLQEQFRDALELLIRLADTFFHGDRSRVIIVPGNHDIDWNKARSAMELATSAGQDVEALLSLPYSRYRWSWRSRELFYVERLDTYEQRLGQFVDLSTSFYGGASSSYPLDHGRPWNLFKLADGRITVCAFNSCVRNDCFSRIGEIPPDAIAQSHLALHSDRDIPSLRIAVWHHDSQGPPLRTDYMDVNAVRLMIDKGYRLGLHGHQHKSDVMPVVLNTYAAQSLGLVSVGSLCAGPADLPVGSGRQYNVIEIADDYRRVRVHIREMAVTGVLGPRRLLEFGGQSYCELSLTPPPERIVNTGRGGGRSIMLVEEIEKLIRSGDFEQAVQKIDEAGDALMGYGRGLVAKALFAGQKWERLVRDLSEPKNADELSMVLRATVEIRDWPTGEAILSSAEESGNYAAATLTDLRRWFLAEKGMHQ